MRDGPTLSIGLPVYNGENYLEQAVRALLAQTYTDFELILCDNASTDGTRAICESFAAQDQRVRYERSDTNLGLVRNFNRAFELSRGRYFKWSAHDDLLGPDFLRLCIEQLEADDTLAVCCTSVAVIDAEGYELEEPKTPAPPRCDPLGVTRLRDASGEARRIESDMVWRRHRGVLLDSTRCYEEFGVIRADAIRATPLRGYYAGSEKVFLTELSLIGKVRVLPEVAMYMRVHDERLSSQAGSRDRQQRYLAPSASRRRAWLPPQVRSAGGYWGAVWRQPMPARQRLGCLWNLVRFCFQVRKWRAVLSIALLGREPVVAAYTPTRGRHAAGQLFQQDQAHPPIHEFSPPSRAQHA